LPAKGGSDTDATVVGSLKVCLPFWRDTMKANQFILDTIEYGYTIPFLTEPPSAFAVDNKSALNHLEFVREGIDQLLIAKVVREISGPAYCCNPLTFFTGKKLRLVLDLSRFVNPYMRYQHFKYKD
jgi:hypothetical protein